jgi:uncharacterized protein YbaP (TraB family)
MGIAMQPWMTKQACRMRRGGALWYSLLAAALLSCCGAALAQQGPADALYWRISKGEREAGFLLGTIHSEDPRVLDFSDSFIAQLESCQLFAMEMVPDLPTLTRLTDYMQYPDADTLQKTIGGERFERVRAALANYQVPLDWKGRMKVWAIVMTLSVPAPKSGFFMDFSLSLRASGAGLKVTGLETLEQQLSFMERMPIDYQLVLLDQALADYQQVDEIHRQMVDAYLGDELAALGRISDQQFAQLDPAIGDYFTRYGITERNQRMAANLLPLLQDSRVFVAVGALHLGGEDGLVALLRARGYTLAPLALPFRPDR